jgi:hypothetical protein
MITDGSFVCGLCGEWMTGCNLCGQAPLIDMRDTLRKEEIALHEAENELRLQERSIRKAAEERNLWNR